MKKIYLIILVFSLVSVLATGCGENLTRSEPGTEPETVAEADMSLDELYLGDGDPYQEKRGSETYSVVSTVTFQNKGTEEVTGLSLWFATMEDISPYQNVTSTDIQPPPVREETGKLGNEFSVIEIDSLPAGATRQVTATYEVTANKYFNYLGNCQGQGLSDYLYPEQYIESEDPEIEQLANQLTMGAANSCAKAVALYEYVTDNLDYFGYNPEFVGAKQALAAGGGDCNEFSDLLVALSRAAGVPARTIEGYAYKSDEETDLGEIKHAWVEFYLPGTGWTPADPTWGRHENSHNAEFSQSDGKHMIVTQGRNAPKLRGFSYFSYEYQGDPGVVTATEDIKITKSASP